MLDGILVYTKYWCLFSIWYKFFTFLNGQCQWLMSMVKMWWRAACHCFRGHLFHRCPAKRHAWISSWAEPMVVRSKVLKTENGAVSVVWWFFSFKKPIVEPTTICWKCPQAQADNTCNSFPYPNQKRVTEDQERMRSKAASATSGNTSEIGKTVVKVKLGVAWRHVCSRGCLREETPMEGWFYKLNSIDRI